MSDQRRYTKPEIAEQLCLLAHHAPEPEKTRLLTLASSINRDRDLVCGARIAIGESRKLLAAVDKVILG
jgi:hypothetical protein